MGFVSFLNAKKKSQSASSFSGSLATTKIAGLILDILRLRVATTGPQSYLKILKIDHPLP